MDYTERPAMDPAYLDRLRAFWEVRDPTERQFNRVDTLYGADRTEAAFDAAADERLAWMLDGLTLPHAPQIVEIGCGIGAVLARLRHALPEATLYGFDIAPSMIDDARQRLGADPRVHLTVTPGDTLSPVADGSIDLVVCSGVFIHFLDIALIRRYCTDTARVLKPGGAFRFNVRYWNPDLAFGRSLGGRAAALLHRLGWYSALTSQAAMAPADFRGVLFTLTDVDTLVRQEGFAPERVLFCPDQLIRVNCHRTSNA